MISKISEDNALTLRLLNALLRINQLVVDLVSERLFRIDLPEKREQRFGRERFHNFLIALAHP